MAHFSSKMERMIENSLQTQLTDWSAEAVWPQYHDNSIANVPATIAALLGAPFSGLPPLVDDLWRPFSEDVQRVVMVILDGMGSNLLETAVSTPDPRVTTLLAQTAVRGQITSVFPSTTVAALSSFWTGLAPIQHGLTGLRLFFPEYAAAGQLLNFSPLFGPIPNALVDAGLEPEAFLHGPGFAEQLAAAGIPAYAVKSSHLVNSALSKMHGRGLKADIGIHSFTDMLVQMRQLLVEKAGRPLFISAYWPSIDTLSHAYTWRGPSVAAELGHLFAQIQRELIALLPPAARAGTVLLLVADHGQAVTPPADYASLADHPDLNRMLLMRPVGEPRVAYLYTRRGAHEDAIAYVNECMGSGLTAVATEQAVAAGLFGPPPYAPEVTARMGDVVVITSGGKALLTLRDMEKAHKMQGRHGSLTRAEMMVPWLGFRLDALPSV